MGETYRSRIVDPRLHKLSLEIMGSWQTLNFLAIKDRKLFPFTVSDSEMVEAQNATYALGVYGINSKPNPFFQKIEAAQLTCLQSVLRRAGDILPQRYTYDTRARRIVDETLNRFNTFPNFTAFRNALETQRALVENQLKSRFPMHTQG